MNVDERRVRKLNNAHERTGASVIYWMNRDMRAHDNWALFYAQYQAQRLNLPLVVFCGLVPQFLDASLRHYLFMIEGLKEVEQTLASRNIGFIVRYGSLPDTLLDISRKLKPSMVVCDYSPLRVPRLWRSRAAKALGCPLFEVDAHNIIPVWQACGHEEHSLRSFRTKIATQLDEFLVAYPRLNRHTCQLPKMSMVNWDALVAGLEVRELGPKLLTAKSGPKAGKHALKSFLINRLVGYPQKRYDPNINGQSGLSAYINFGQLSAQRAALEIVEARIEHKSLREPGKAFFEEVVIHRELAENFCFYNRFYDKFEGFPKWARDTLRRHSRDKRPILYRLADLENGATSDELWNAAQRQLVSTGSMHGLLRTYWGKKLLEWSDDPQKALSTAITLNNRYALDGRDPSSYAGIAWCIGGVHDRICPETDIFGQVRSVNKSNLTKHFDARQFIDNHS